VVDGCAILPVRGVPNVFTTDVVYTRSTPTCGPNAFTPALVILRGLANPGIGHTMAGDYTSGNEMPRYMLVGYNCGQRSILVPGKQGGQYWNAAVTAANAIQAQTETLNNGRTGTWDWLGEIPEPVTQVCLQALPADPCWGTGLPANYTQPASLPPPAIPDAYCGNWQAHGSLLTINCAARSAIGDDGLHTAPNATINSRTYVWCFDPATGQHNPQPCDTLQGNKIISGAFLDMWAEPSTDPNSPGLSVTYLGTRLDNNGRGEIHNLNIIDGNVLTIDNNPGAGFCNATTDPTISRNWCGA
jgi:hypothetical protein